MGLIKYVSFDIFDTCIVRATGKPISVFYDLARACVKVQTSSNVADFVKIRKEGEYLARIKKKSQEICMQDIYDECDFSSLSFFSKEEIIHRELECERNVLLPVVSIRKIIDSYRSRGVAISFISDMYLPENFLKEILVKYGFYNNTDSLYISSTYGKKKSNGELFEFFKAKNKKVNRFNWIHFGDNFSGDIIQAWRKGAIPIRVFHAFNDYEYIDNTNFISGLTNKIDLTSSISKSLRLSHDYDEKYEFAVDVIAPILVPFVWNLLKSAKRRNLSDLYFFARDGYILYLIAKELKSDFNDIRLHYLYVSRRSIYFPTISEINVESINNVFPTKIMRYDTFLSYLTIKEDELDDSIIEELQKASSLKQMLEIVSIWPTFLDKIKEKHKKQRQLLLDYFQQAGLASYNKHQAIVDLRGSRKSHELINSFLNENNYPSVYGFYYEVTNDRITPSNSDMYESCIYREDYINTDLYESLRTFTSIFEQYFAVTPQNRTAYYVDNENKIDPVFEKETVDERKIMLFETNKNACIDYAKYAKHVFYDEDGYYISSFCLSKFLNILSYPPHNLLKLFADYEMSESMYEKKVFLKRLCIGDMFNHEQILWFKGSIAYTFGRWTFMVFYIKKWIKKIIFK